MEGGRGTTSPSGGAGGIWVGPRLRSRATLASLAQAEIEKERGRASRRRSFLRAMGQPWEIPTAQEMEAAVENRGCCSLWRSAGGQRER